MGVRSLCGGKTIFFSETTVMMIYHREYTGKSGLYVLISCLK